MQRVVLDDAVDQTERVRPLGVDDVAEEIELARLSRADEPGQAPRAAKIAGIPDPGKSRSKAGGAPRYPQVASHCETEPGADGRPIDHRDHDFRHRAQ